MASGFRRGKMIHSIPLEMNGLSLTWHTITVNPIRLASIRSVTKQPVCYWKWICLDKIRKKAFLMKDIYNDFTGSHMQSSDIQAQPEGMFAIGYQAVDLKEMAEKALADPKTPADIRQRMEKIDAEIKADDNPVLVVGRLKR